jgi:hypothetical protein
MIIEYPVVLLGASRFRLQVMASHSIAEVQHAARVIGNVMRQVKGEQIKTRPHFSSTPSESALCFQLHSRVVPLT